MKRLLIFFLLVLSCTVRADWGVWPQSRALMAQATLSPERLILSPWIVKVSLRNTSTKRVSGSLSPCPLVYVIRQKGKTLYTYPLKQKFQRPETCTMELIEFTLRPGESQEVYLQHVFSRGDPPIRVPKGTYRIVGRLFVMAGSGKPTPQTVPFDNTVVVR
ncbi:hypothetical protein [Deinococcus cellulosilyticus]|uniref:Uncharacterized protein n=1 Tax=Deinococcus cellulosilyticus (strain DSM 18568 / NBRC 106333 / KACC 11606 / 5516J-15) TaxID=1223518 RepID=A0A511N8H0_DEIC1|nr:hypothetical protein [Deinococcus cellulosilyticus]GEM49135.1 hypothetical protein DC3_47700 [Deinococcus cellulosilyticus NBRC 106333 = KACC 11606]